MHFIGSILDKKDNTVNFYHTLGKYCHAELSSFLLSKYAELIKMGHCSPSYVPTIRDKRIIFAMIDEKIAGSMLYLINANTAAIDFTVVEDCYRNNGIYKLLHEKFHETMVREKIKFSRSQIHINNTAAIEASKKTGYDVEYIRLVKTHI